MKTKNQQQQKLNSFKQLLPIKSDILRNAVLVDSSNNYSSLPVLVHTTDRRKGDKLTREDKIFLESVRPLSISSTPHIHNVDNNDLRYGLNNKKSEITYNSNYLRKYFTSKFIRTTRHQCKMKWILDGKEEKLATLKDSVIKNPFFVDYVAIKAENMLKKACLQFEDIVC